MIQLFCTRSLQIAVAALLVISVISCENDPTKNYGGGTRDTAKVKVEETKVSDSLIIKSKKQTIESNSGEASFVWPIVEGNASAEVLEKINKFIGDTAVSEESLKLIEKEYKECGCGTVGSSYTVNYNKEYILSLTAFIQTLAAYPDEYSVNMNFDIHNGNLIKVEDLLKDGASEDLLKLLNKMLDARIEDAKSETEDSETEPEDREFLNEQFSNAVFDEERINNFIITPTGITFYYDFGFPHVAQALEPENSFPVSNEELQFMLKKDGVLGNRIKK